MLSMRSIAREPLYGGERSGERVGGCVRCFLFASACDNVSVAILSHSMFISVCVECFVVFVSSLSFLGFLAFLCLGVRKHVLSACGMAVYS
jgi:hypothetical protein